MHHSTQPLGMCWREGCSVFVLLFRPELRIDKVVSEFGPLIVMRLMGNNRDMWTG